MTCLARNGVKIQFELVFWGYGGVFKILPTTAPPRHKTQSRQRNNTNIYLAVITKSQLQELWGGGTSIGQSLLQITYGKG